MKTGPDGHAAGGRPRRASRTSGIRHGQLAAATLAPTDVPGEVRRVGSPGWSNTIVTGTRCTTSRKLPVAFSGASSAKVAPVPRWKMSRPAEFDLFATFLPGKLPPPRLRLFVECPSRTLAG